ncbi:MAG: hypothetical protein RI564_07935 [Gracilimonas sp.]|nr:hypothetical protein [Gracilimonas sp.]
MTFGKKKEVVGYFVPHTQGKESKRQLGKLDGKASVDFKMNEEEILG